jgi:Cu/Ag efflux pump CusA
VFVPLLFLQGLEGRFFRPLGIAYIASIFASLLVALTVTPAMCRYLLRGRLVHREGEGWLVRAVKRVYRPALQAALGHRRLVMALAVAATAASLLLASTFGRSFLPEFNEGTFTVFLMAPPGTSLDESSRLAQGVLDRIREIDGVRGVVGRTGRAERDEHAEPVSNTEIEVAVKPGRSREEIRGKLDEILAAVPGITTTIGQPIEHRISHILSGTPAAIAINVFGDDLAKLRALAKEIEAALKSVPGARDVAANREVMVDSVPIRYRPADLAAAGLTPADVAEQLKVAFRGEAVAEVNEGVKRYQMVVRLAPEERRSVRDVRDFMLQGRGGARLRLGEVADVGVERTSNLIARESGRRKAVVSCNVAEGANLGDLVDAVRAKVEPIVHREGYSVHFGGQFEAQQSAANTILLMGAGVIVLIFLLLQMALHGAKAALLVMVNLPLALIGGIFAIYLTESDSLWRNTLGLFGIGAYQAPVISIASMVGFVTLFGIAVRNGILLVNHYAWLRHNEGLAVRDAVMRGSMERLVPILMTALAAILGLIPLALAGGEPGSELLAPLSIVVLGGLVSSTFLNLVVVPAGYLMLSGAEGAGPGAGAGAPQVLSTGESPDKKENRS